MLSKKSRISRRSFPTFANGKSVFSPLFTAKIVKNTLEISRFSVVVSKKVSKTAIARNLLRRRFYSALAKIRKNSVSGIFYLKKEAVKASFREIESELQVVFAKA